MRVSMSAIGSVNIQLPARFTNAREKSLVGHFAETDAAKIEVTHVAAEPTTRETATYLACRELRLAGRFCFVCC